MLTAWATISLDHPLIVSAGAGTSLLGAGYCLYSSSTLFVLTLGSGVWGFTYDSIIGEFVLSHPDIRIPEEGKIYAFNEGNYQARASAFIALPTRMAAYTACRCLTSRSSVETGSGDSCVRFL